MDFDKYDKKPRRRNVPRPSAGFVRALGIGTIGLGAVCYFLAFGIPEFLTAPAEAAAEIDFGVEVRIESKPSVPEPVTPDDFWDVVKEGRQKYRESDFRHENWLSENTDRLVRINGSVLDARRQCCGDDDDCTVFTEMPAKPANLRLHIDMPCRFAGQLVKEQEFVADCKMDGDWDAREKIPDFDRCKLVQVSPVEADEEGTQ